jgi:uncharacterized protein YjiS (DUF1127 family)
MGEHLRKILGGELFQGARCAVVGEEHIDERDGLPRGEGAEEIRHIRRLQASQRPREALSRLSVEQLPDEIGLKPVQGAPIA